MVEETKEHIEGLESEEFDNDIYSELTFAARLRDIRLVGSEFSIKPEIFEALQGGGKLSFSGEPVSFHLDQEDGEMLGNYSWIAEVRYKRRKVLKASSEYVVAYSGFEGFSEDYVRMYFEKVGRFATFPYFRSDFSHFSSRSGIMLPPLPALNERVN